MKRLAELTYKDVPRADAIALWPIGSTEAHGPHLPLSTDVIIAEETCLRAAPKLEGRFQAEVVVLPSLAFTVTDFAAPFAGTISIPKETALAYVRDVVASVARLGFRAVCLVNAHLEPAHRHMLRDAVKAARTLTGAPVVLADPAERRFAETLTEEFKKSAHAGCYETSLVLAARPELVGARETLAPLDVDLVAKMLGGARTLVDAGAPQAYLGDPKAATAAEGEATYERLAEIVCTVIAEALGSPA
jgi:creatinine amidohydrolase